MNLQIGQPTFNAREVVFTNCETTAHGLEREQFKHLAQFETITDRIKECRYGIGNRRRGAGGFVDDGDRQLQTSAVGIAIGDFVELRTHDWANKGRVGFNIGTDDDDVARVQRWVGR